MFILDDISIKKVINRLLQKKARYIICMTPYTKLNV